MGFFKKSSKKTAQADGSGDLMASLQAAFNVNDNSLPTVQAIATAEYAKLERIANAMTAARAKKNANRGTGNMAEVYHSIHSSLNGLHASITESDELSTKALRDHKAIRKELEKYGGGRAISSDRYRDLCDRVSQVSIDFTNFIEQSEENKDFYRSVGKRAASVGCPLR